MTTVDTSPTTTAAGVSIVEGLLAELEKNPKVLSFETIIVNLVAACAFVVGLFRPDLKSQISATPQAAITTAAIIAFVIFNAWNLYIKKTHVGIKVAALVRIAELDLAKALPGIEKVASLGLGLGSATTAPAPASVTPAPAGAADPTA